MKAAPLIIVGAGGFGREVHDVVEAIEDQRLRQGAQPYEVLGFVDDGSPDEELIDDRGVPFLGGVSALASLPDDVQYVIGIGDGATRRRIDEWATGLGRTPATLVHPSAVIGRHRVTIGPGSIICAQVVITTNVVLGRHVHLNLGVTVGHEAILGDYVTANPNASVSGEVRLGSEVNLGTGSSVIQGRCIGARTVVGAGAAVVRDLPNDVTAVGVPARPMA
ncbi:acetyltransferase [Geodermatophilus sp. SYSU D00814]